MTTIHFELCDPQIIRRMKKPSAVRWSLPSLKGNELNLKITSQTARNQN